MIAFGLTDHIRFISENWLAPRSNPDLFFFGFRFTNKTQREVEVVLMHPSNTETYTGNVYPWVGVAVNFDMAK